MYIHTMVAKEIDLNSMENCVCFNLRWVSRAISKFFVAELHHHGLLPTQTPILAALAGRPSAHMAELSDWLAMDRTTLLRNLRPLERDGFVEISNKGRGQKVSLSLTVKGRAALQNFLPDWQVAQQKIVETLGKDRWTEIIRDLEWAANSLN